MMRYYVCTVYVLLKSSLGALYVIYRMRDVVESPNKAKGVAKCFIRGRDHILTFIKCIYLVDFKWTYNKASESK